MKHPAGVTLIALARAQDRVDILSRILHGAEYAIHYTRVSAAAELPDALTQLNPALIVLFAEEFDAEPDELAAVRDRHAAGVPLLVVYNDVVTEERIATDMAGGAQDAVSLGQRQRLRALALRELRAVHRERALKASSALIRRYLRQLRSLVDGLSDGGGPERAGAAAAPSGAGGAPAESVAAAPLLRSAPPVARPPRRDFLGTVEQHLQAAGPDELHLIVWIRPDKFAEVREEIGSIPSEHLLNQLETLIHGQVAASDVPGRIGDNAFAVLIKRATLADCETWSRELLHRIAGHVFEAGKQSLSVTCSAGLAHSDGGTPLEALLEAAEQSCRQAQDEGGNRLHVPETLQQNSRELENARLWKRRVQTALAENRFKLAHQAIAPLHGSEQGLYDMLVRMVGEDGQEILPSDFMPTAEQTNSMAKLDRWVIRATLDFVLERKPVHAFVRLSRESLEDTGLPAWLQNQLRNTGVQPARLCFQLTEELCAGQLKQAKSMAETLRRLGCQIAIEHFGTTRNTLQLLQHMPAQYVKIDGSLIQGLATNELQQKRVRGLIEAAQAQRVLTIAERVEDANTMAVLFRLGMAYMQGYYVQEPEVVLEDKTRSALLGA